MTGHREVLLTGGTQRGGGTPWPPSAPQVLTTSCYLVISEEGAAGLLCVHLLPWGRLWVERRESSPLVQLAASEHGHFAEICQTEKEGRKSWFVYKGFPLTKFCSWLYNLEGWEKEDDLIFNKPQTGPLLMCYVSMSMSDEQVMRTHRGDGFWEIGFKLTVEEMENTRRRDMNLLPHTSCLFPQCLSISSLLPSQVQLWEGDQAESYHRPRVESGGERPALPRCPLWSMCSLNTTI